MIIQTAPQQLKGQIENGREIAGEKVDWSFNLIHCKSKILKIALWSFLLTTYVSAHAPEEATKREFLKTDLILSYSLYYGYIPHFA